MKRSLGFREIRGFDRRFTAALASELDFNRCPALKLALSHAFTLESPEELVKLLMPGLYPRTIKSESLGVQSSIF